MWNYIRTGLQPGRWLASVGVLVGLTVLVAICASGVSAQERRSRPTLIIVQDNPRPELSRTVGDTPVTGKNGSVAADPAIALERSIEPSVNAEDSQPGGMLARELPQPRKPMSPRLPPLPEVPSFPAVDRPAPSPDAKLPVNLKGNSASGPQRDVVSAVQPASFSTSEFPEARIGGRPLVVVEAATSPPAYYRTSGEALPVWQIVGLSVAISFLLALSLMAFSVLLLTSRQQIVGNPGSVIRFELAQAGGGSCVLPFPMIPSTSQPGAKESPLRDGTRVADFAEDILGSASLGPILGGKHGPQEDKQCEREQSILQQIFEDNVALQKKGA